MDIKLPKTPKDGEIFKHKSDAIYYYRWNGFAWETISYTSNPDSGDSGDNVGVSNFSIREVLNEVPSGLINSENREFILNYEPIKNSETVYLNGMLQKNGEDHDYVILKNSIYFNEAPISESLIICNYFIRSAISVKNEIPEGKKDGNNKDFFMVGNPETNTERIFLNGLLQKNGLDYVIEDNKISFIEPPIENSIIICFYDSILS